MFNARVAGFEGEWVVGFGGDCEAMLGVKEWLVLVANRRPVFNAIMWRSQKRNGGVFEAFTHPISE